MLLDGSEAALGLLQEQNFTGLLPYPADAGQPGPLLDAAMLAEANPSAPAETGAAFMAAPEDDAGELLIASLMEVIDAPSEAAALAQASTSSDPIELELSSMDIIVPESDELWITAAAFSELRQKVLRDAAALPGAESKLGAYSMTSSHSNYTRLELHSGGPAQIDLTRLGHSNNPASAYAAGEHLIAEAERALGRTIRRP